MKMLKPLVASICAAIVILVLDIRFGIVQQRSINGFQNVLHEFADFFKGNAAFSDCMDCIKTELMFRFDALGLRWKELFVLHITLGVLMLLRMMRMQEHGDKSKKRTTLRQMKLQTASAVKRIVSSVDGFARFQIIPDKYRTVSFMVCLASDMTTMSVNMKSRKKSGHTSLQALTFYNADGDPTHFPVKAEIICSGGKLYLITDTPMTVTDSGGARFETTRHTVDTGDAVVFGGCKESFIFCTDDEKED